MKLNLRKLVLGVAIATLPQLMNAQDQTIEVDVETALINVDGTERDVAIDVSLYQNDPFSEYIHATHLWTGRFTAGGNTSSAAVPFKIPEAPVGKVLKSVKFETTITETTWSAALSLDLYAVIDNTPWFNTDGTDYFEGAFGTHPTATGVQEGYYAKGTAANNERIETSSVGTTNLTNLLKQHYESGSENEFIKLSLNVNTEFANGGLVDYARAKFASGDDATNAPKLVFVFGDPDVTPPVISTFEVRNIKSTLAVVFDEIVDQTTAEDIANYSLSNGATITTATLLNDGMTVILDGSQLVGDEDYTVTVNNVEDTSGNAITNGTSTLTYPCPYAVATSWQNDTWGVNPPENAFDGDPATLWSGDGIGTYIQYNFCELTLVKSIYVTYPSADSRTYEVSVQVSENGVDYTEIGTASLLSSTDAQEITVTESNAMYIRLVGGGNSVNTWNKFAEIDIATSSLSNETVNKQVLDIYPNPVKNGEFTVSTVGMDGWVEMAIYNVTGKKVYSKSINAASKKATVNANLSQGLYIVKLTDGVSARTQKITVQ